MSAKREVRFLKDAEVRMTEDGKITGLIPYNSRSENLGGFTEIVRPGTFQRAIAGKEDVRALFNHNPSFVLGRNKAGTLNLTDGPQGMAFEINPPNAQWAKDLQESIGRRDISGASFGFTVEDDEWVDERSADGKSVSTTRYLNSVNLFDVGPVTYPAYEGSTSSVRSLWPDGMPEGLRSHVKDCTCPCEKCQSGDHDSWRCYSRGCHERRAATMKNEDAANENRTVVHIPGHKDSKGEEAPWVIKQEGTGKILGSFKTEEEAKQQLKTMEAKKHDEQKSLDLALEDMARQILAIKLAAKV